MWTLARLKKIAIKKYKYNNYVNLLLIFNWNIKTLNISMSASVLNEDTNDQICDLLGNLLQIEKLKNKDMRILLDKIVRKYGGKVLNK